MGITIQLERFEGPLGLLLHLIRKEEMDIFDINIHQITEQYLAYIKAMKQLDLEMAGEFVAMAATLIHIKSKMLLPQYDDDGEIIEDEDPRKELVNKLLEYQKFQEASQRLYERPLVGRDVFLRGQKLNVTAEDDDEIVMEEGNALFALISAYRTALKNVKKGVHRVMGELQSIASRILEIKDFFKVGQSISFRELITKAKDDSDNQKNQVLVTFISLLELAKMGFVSIFQTVEENDIHIETKKPVESNVIERVESYDGAYSEEQADAIMAQTEMEVLYGSLDEDENEEPVMAATDEEILAEEQKISDELGPFEVQSSDGQQESQKDQQIGFGFFTQIIPLAEEPV